MKGNLVNNRSTQFREISHQLDGIEVLQNPLIECLHGTLIHLFATHVNYRQTETLFKSDVAG